MKRALVLSGGAALGAFQAGVLCTERVKYDAVFGASIGALNGLFAASHDYDGLVDAWTEIGRDRGNAFTSNIINMDGSIDYIGIILQLFTKYPLKSIAKWSGIKKILARRIDKGRPKKPFHFDVTTLTDYQTHTLNHVDYEDLELLNGLLASSSVPAIFPELDTLTAKNGDMLFSVVDGGIGNTSTLSSCVDWIKQTESPEDWMIDIIQTSGGGAKVRSLPNNIIQSALSVFAVLLNNNRTRDNNIFFAKNRSEDEALVKFKYRNIAPLIDLGNPLDFRNRSLKSSFRHGQQMAYKKTNEWHG